jgi:DNA-binding transcriptional MerR regulator
MRRVRSKAAPRPRKPRPPAPDLPSSDGERALKIGEAARAVGVEAYVLRFWETQFAFLRPKHSRSKHRFYEPRDIETLRLVKRLLHTEGYTITGARKRITDLGLDRLLDKTIPPDADPSPSSIESNHSGTAVPSSAVASAGPVLSGASDAVGGSVQRRLTEIRDDLRSLHKLLEH